MISSDDIDVSKIGQQLSEGKYSYNQGLREMQAQAEDLHLFSALPMVS